MVACPAGVAGAPAGSGWAGLKASSSKLPASWRDGMKPDNIYLATAAVTVPFATALLVAVVNHFQQGRAARRGRHAERLLQQLEQVYGPFYFYTTENADLLNRSGIVNQQYSDHYIKKQYSERGQKTISEEADVTIGVMNTYTARVTENNETMVRIITEHFALIEPDDLEAFRDLVTNVNRYKVESPMLPSRLRVDAEPIVFLRPEFAERIAKRVNELRERWRSL
jgi:hypothetical protein